MRYSVTTQLDREMLEKFLEKKDPTVVVRVTRKDDGEICERDAMQEKVEKFILDNIPLQGYKILRMAEKKDIVKRTLYRAKKRLGVKSELRKGVWWWLPKSDEKRIAALAAMGDKSIEELTKRHQK